MPKTFQTHILLPFSFLNKQSQQWSLRVLAFLTSCQYWLWNVVWCLCWWFCFLQDASSSEIRKAYRKLSLTLHPDKNKDENAENQFRQVGVLLSLNESFLWVNVDCVHGCFWNSVYYNWNIFCRLLLVSSHIRSPQGWGKKTKVRCVHYSLVDLFIFF